MTTNNWLLKFPSNLNMTGDMLQCVVLEDRGVWLLSLVISTPDSTQVFFGDYKNWFSSLIYFPIKLHLPSAPEKILTLNGIQINVGTQVTTQIPCYDYVNNFKCGFTLGEYYVKPKFNDFRDYEPYTSFRIYLPYYGNIELPCNEIMGRYLQFRLAIDPFTGQAVYYICTTKNSISWNNAPYRCVTSPATTDFFIDDSNSKIIGIYNFQLGAQIPISSTGAIDVARNLTLGTLRLGASLAASGISEAIGAYQTITTTADKIVKTKRNPKTGRQINTSTTSKVKESVTDYGNYQKGHRINECFSTASQALSSLALSPTSDRPNNLLVNNIGCQSIKIIRKTAKFVDTGSGYAKLYGYPVGAVYKLSDLSGYTVITTCHLDGEGFTGTLEEKLMIEEALSDGIILPENNVTYNVTTNITNGFATPATTTIPKNGFTTIYITPDANCDYPDTITVTGASYTYEKTEGAVHLSNPTGNVTVEATCISTLTTYSITTNITNGSYEGPSSVSSDTPFINVKIIEDTGYDLPDSVTVTGAIKVWDKDTATLTLSDYTDNIVITAVCTPTTPPPEPTVYQIISDITNGSLMDIPATVQQGGSAVSGTIQPNSGYVLPASITVSGCSYTYDNVTGVITLSNYTGNIQIIGECGEEPHSVGTQDYYLKTNYDYVFKDTINYSSIPNFERIRFEFPFHSNGNNFTAIEVANSNSEFAGIYYEDTEANLTHVYTTSWSVEAYKTITPDIDGKSYRRLYNMNSQFLIDNFTESPILGTFYALSGTITGGTLNSYDNYILGGSSNTTIGYNVYENHVATKTCNVTNATATPHVDTKEFVIQNVTGDVVFNIILPEHQNNLSWIFKASPKSLGAQGTSYSIDFTSNDTHFTILRNGTTFKEKFYLYYNDTQAYASGWKNPNFRDVIFDTEPETSLLTYLQNNATLMS